MRPFRQGIKPLDYWPRRKTKSGTRIQYGFWTATRLPGTLNWKTASGLCFGAASALKKTNWKPGLVNSKMLPSTSLPLTRSTSPTSKDGWRKQGKSNGTIKTLWKEKGGWNDWNEWSGWLQIPILKTTPVLDGEVNENHIKLWFLSHFVFYPKYFRTKSHYTVILLV